MRLDEDTFEYDVVDICFNVAPDLLSKHLVHKLDEGRAYVLQPKRHLHVGKRPGGCDEVV